ncbi:MAG: MBL fold metallo-hydrolase [Thermotogae bacterium]|nr:MAG: MBL fold metallo-hydrolase [Thermotogota bacterium]
MTRRDSLKVYWLGHACFLIEGQGVKIITDPYDPSIGYPMFDVAADIVTESHQHFDHNAHGYVKGNPQIVSTPGHHKFERVEIVGYETYHDDAQGKHRGKNIVFRMVVDGVSVVHMGDIGEVIDGVSEKLKPVDVLMIPVGGHFTVDAREAKEIVDTIEPRIVIPMHYKTEHLKFVGIAPVEEFLALFDEHEIAENPFTVPSDLEDYAKKLVVFRTIFRTR